MGSSDLFNTDTENWEDKSTIEQLRYLGDDLPQIAMSVGKSIEELEQKIEENDEETLAMANTKMELQRLVSVAKIAETLLDKLETEYHLDITKSIEKETSLGEIDAEELAESLEIEAGDPEEINLDMGEADTTEEINVIKELDSDNDAEDVEIEQENEVSSDT